MSKLSNLLSSPCTVTMYKHSDNKNYLTIECMNSFAEYELRYNVSDSTVNLMCSSDRSMITSILCTQVEKVHDSETQFHFDVIPVSMHNKFDQSLMTFKSLSYVINVINNVVHRIHPMTVDKIELDDFETIDDNAMDDMCNDSKLLGLIPCNINEEKNQNEYFIRLHTSITNQHYVWLTLYRNECNDTTFVDMWDKNYYEKFIVPIECIVHSKVFKDKLMELGIFGYTINDLDSTMELFINEEFNKFLKDYIIDPNDTNLDIDKRMITFSYLNSNEVETHLLDNINISDYR